MAQGQPAAAPAPAPPAATPPAEPKVPGLADTKEDVEKKYKTIVELKDAVEALSKEIPPKNETGEKAVVTWARDQAVVAKDKVKIAEEKAKTAVKAINDAKELTQADLNSLVETVNTALADAQAAKKQAEDARDVARPSVSAVVRAVAATRAELDRLKSEKTEQERADADARGVRLMQYGVAVGVAAMLYTPGPWGNTLDGVAGGAMPYVSIHPAYWRDDEATNLFCALQWSTSDARALASANRAQREAETQDDGANPTSDGTAATKAKTDEAEQALASADRAARDAEEAERDAKTETDTKKKEDKTNEVDDKARTAKQKVDEAKRLVEELQAARERSQARRIAKLERKHVKDMRGLREEKVDELQVELRQMLNAHNEKVDGRDERDALIGHAEQELAAEKDPEKARAACESGVTTLLDNTTWLHVPSRKARAAYLACEIAVTRRTVVELSIAADGYRGEGTSCAAHKFGLFAGYPGVFSATSVIQNGTTQDREKRELTPIVSFGFAFAPNALTSFLSGPWFATTEINNTSEFVWGMNIGFALTTDVFTALAD